MTFDAEGVRARLTTASPGPWAEYFTVHGDPFVLSGRHYFPGDILATVSIAAEDYGRADAILIAHAPTDLAAALDEIDALRAAMAASTEEAAPGTLTPREQRIYAAGFEFGRKAAATGARLAAERGLAGEGT